MLADFNLLRCDLLQRRKHRKLNLDFAQFIGANRLEAGILQRGGLRAMRYDFDQRSRRTDLTDAPTKASALAQRNERSE